VVRNVGDRHDPRLAAVLSPVEFRRHLFCHRESLAVQRVVAALSLTALIYETSVFHGVIGRVAERDAGLFDGPKKLKFDQMFRRDVLFRAEIRRSRLERSLQYRAANTAPKVIVAAAIVNLRIILPPPMIAHATPTVA
jgi:hypothetical protein